MALNQQWDSRDAPEPGKRRLHLRDVANGEAGAAYDGVGADLHAARVRADKELADIARELRISGPHLSAIEEGRFGDLPGTAYALGFVRSYAEHVGLDGAAVVEAFKDETSPYAARSKLVFPSPAPAGRSPGARLIAVSLLLVAAVFAGWYTIAEGERTVVELVPEVPENLRVAQLEPETARGDEAVTAAVANEVPQSFVAAPLDLDAPSAAAAGAPVLSAAEAVLGETRDPAGATSVAAAVTETPVTDDGAATDVDETVEATETRDLVTLVAAVAVPQVVEDAGASAEQAVAADPPSEPANAVPEPAAAPQGQIAALAPRTAAIETRGSVEYVPQVFGAANTDARIVVIASADSWVQIRGPGDELLLTRVMHAGDRYLVPNRGDLTMLTGNAGALEIVVDGTPIAPIGEVGAVRRDISLNADTMLAENPPTP